MSNPLDDLPQNEWDALILSIIEPYFKLCYSDSLLTIEDLKQEAWIGLTLASQRFDSSYGCKFSTFAYHYIFGHVLRYINKCIKNKPDQIETDLDIRSYEDSDLDNEDLMQTILAKVVDYEDADLLIEKYVKNKSLRQIGKERNVSHEQIRKRLNKILESLSRRLQYENT